MKGPQIAILVWAAAACAAAQLTPREVTVAADGTGQFKSVQEAVDHAPTHSHQRFVIHIKPGIYKERVTVPPEKTFLTLRGDDAKTTVITFDVHPAPTGGPNGRALITFDTPTVFIQANDFTAENITFENSAGRQGQALALTIMSDRGVFRYCRFLGFQDTLLAQAGRQYFDHCYIQGATDFIFGGSTAVFDNCEIHVTANGYITAPNTPQDQRFGYVFLHSKITGEPNVLTYLSRPWRGYAATVFLNTEMSSAVRPVGWNNWNDPAKEKTARYGEYASTGPGGDISARAGWARRLTDPEAKTYSIENVLGGVDGWNPHTGVVRSQVKITAASKNDPAPLDRGSVLLATAASDDGLRFAYSTDGYRWTLAGGSRLAVPDLQNPSLLRASDGTFHIVWARGARGDKSFSYASSKDLITWTHPQRIEIMSKQNALDVASPRLFWDSDHTQFIVTWASTMAANSIQAFQEEVDTNPRIWYSTTRDFQSFADPKLLFDPNYASKDGVLLKDGSKFALLHTDNTIPMHRLRVAFGDSPIGPWGPSRDAFTEKFIENPAAIQLAGEWWIYDTNSKTGATGLIKTRDFWTFSDSGTIRFPDGLHMAGVLEVPRSILDKLLK
ncbi:MAG TPA: pectinesterase family protein [Bryobacteraceae bacterium]|jgi:pectinesterase